MTKKKYDGLCIDNSKSLSSENHQGEISLRRRDVVKGIMGMGVCACAANCIAVEAEEQKVDVDDPTRLLPQENDCLIYADGDREGEIIKIDDLVEGEGYVSCWPRDPETDVVRSGSRFNKLIAIRLDNDELNSKTKDYAEEGIVVYSGVCTHKGCDISAWIKEKQQFFCYCHYSRFDPKKFGKVTYGPARKKLPIIPVRIDDGILIINGEFSRKPG